MDKVWKAGGLVLGAMMESLVKVLVTIVSLLIALGLFSMYVVATDGLHPMQWEQMPPREEVLFPREPPQDHLSLLDWEDRDAPEFPLLL